jgi:hypothetical protein
MAKMLLQNREWLMRAPVPEVYLGELAKVSKRSRWKKTMLGLPQYQLLLDEWDPWRV